MNDVDIAVNELAREIVAHPASSRRWLRLRLTPEECARAANKVTISYGHQAGELLFAVRATLLRRHCGRRMAVVGAAACRCGNHGFHRKFIVCTCLHCGFAGET